ncbi:MAG: F-box protein [Rickettsiales bacterium]|nr:MAG: F-box protein [Rickettsiales bacterium]
MNITHDILSHDILSHHIFPYLDLTSLIKARTVCKEWRNVDLANINSIRKLLLDLYLSIIDKKWFIKTRQDTYTKLISFDREKHLSTLKNLDKLRKYNEKDMWFQLRQKNFANLLVTVPLDYEMWVMEWPEKAVYGLLWPGLNPCFYRETDFSKATYKYGGFAIYDYTKERPIQSFTSVSLDECYLNDNSENNSNDDSYGIENNDSNNVTNDSENKNNSNVSTDSENESCTDCGTSEPIISYQVWNHGCVYEDHLVISKANIKYSDNTCEAIHGKVYTTSDDGDRFIAENWIDYLNNQVYYLDALWNRKTE